MDLDRGALVNLDRRLLAELDREERFQMVRLPVSPTTWKRYCDSAGISMGRAIVALINRELANVADLMVDDSPVVSCWRDERRGCESGTSGISSRGEAAGQK